MLAMFTPRSPTPKEMHRSQNPFDSHEAYDHFPRFSPSIFSSRKTPEREVRTFRERRVYLERIERVLRCVHLRLPSPFATLQGEFQWSIDNIAAIVSQDQHYTTRVMVVTLSQRKHTCHVPE